MSTCLSLYKTEKHLDDSSTQINTIQHQNLVAALADKSKQTTTNAKKISDLAITSSYLNICIKTSLQIPDPFFNRTHKLYIYRYFVYVAIS